MFTLSYRDRQQLRVRSRTARLIAHGMGKREAHEAACLVLARRHQGTDFLAGRTFATDFADATKNPRTRDRVIENLRRFAVDKFFHYGPSAAGMWPGDTLVFDGTGWVVQRGNG
jgi:hypothetical protein